MPILCSIEMQRTSLRAPRLCHRARRELGDDEGDSPSPRRCVGQAGEHQVDDVGRELVLAVGDEDLLPEQRSCRRPAVRRGCAWRRGRAACGSVRFIVLPHSPLTSLGGQVRFCSALAAIRSASAWPWLRMGSMVKAMLAAFHISITGVDTSLGRSLAAELDRQADRPSQPAAQNCMGLAASPRRRRRGRRPASGSPARRPRGSAAPARRRQAAGLLEDGADHVGAGLLRSQAGGRCRRGPASSARMNFMSPQGLE